MTTETLTKADPFAGIARPVYLFSTEGEWKGRDWEKKVFTVPGVDPAERMRDPKGLMVDRNYANRALSDARPLEGGPRWTEDGQPNYQALMYKCAICANKTPAVYTQAPPKHHDCFELREIARGVKSADCICPECVDFIGPTPVSVINHLQKAHPREWKQIQAKEAAEAAQAVAGPAVADSNRMAALEAKVELLTDLLLKERAAKDAPATEVENPDSEVCKHAFGRHSANCPKAG